MPKGTKSWASQMKDPTFFQRFTLNTNPRYGRTYIPIIDGTKKMTNPVNKLHIAGEQDNSQQDDITCWGEVKPQREGVLAIAEKMMEKHDMPSYFSDWGYYNTVLLALSQMYELGKKDALQNQSHL